MFPATCPVRVSLVIRNGRDFPPVDFHSRSVLPSLWRDSMHTRRSILKLGTLAAAAALGRRVEARTSAPSPNRNAVEGIPRSASGATRDNAQWRTVPYTDVTLHDGPMLEQFRAQHATLLSM